MRMKKLLGGVAIGLIALGGIGLGKTALAEETSVEYAVDSTYTLIIPQRVELSSNSVTNMSIKTVNRNLELGNTMEVTISSGLDADGEIKLERSINPSDTLTSSVKVGGSLVPLSNPVVGEFSGYEMNEAEVGLIEFGIPQGNKLAGTYTQTLVFTAKQKMIPTR